MATKTQQARIITPQELGTLRYPLPDSWKKVMGILKGKRRVDPLRYQRQVRAEWEKRLKRQYRLADSPRHGR